MKKLLLALVCVLISAAAFAQTGTLTGRILDGSNGEGLIGANVSLKNDRSKGAMADLNGNYTIKNVPAGEQTLVVSFIGYLAQEIEVTVAANQTKTVDAVTLQSDAIGLDEIEVVASIAQDRKTPVAVSTIKAATIETKLGAQEFPEILKVTPGVYATKQGGGFGDSRINLRGFNSANVAVMVNGVPVNDMESGWVYWSNWAGLGDVTRTMQVQRGLGASKVAVPSIGGTINILTKTTDMEKGGAISHMIGNDGYNKTALTLSSGITESGWAVTVSGARVEGDGYIDGTPFKGYSYFLNISKMINDAHTISFTGFGAPQWHGQRQTRQSIETFRNAPQGSRFNADWGYLNGQLTSVEDNFYHKPQMSLNHYWTISPSTELSTAAYVSTGTGGGGGQGGNYDLFKNRIGNQYGPIDLDSIVEANENSVTGNAEAFLRASRNDHKWYGVLSTLDHEVNENLTILGGLDLRHYRGSHFYEITNLLGADYFAYNGQALKEGDKYNYNYDGIVGWQGAFAQAEYSVNKLSTFLSLSASNTSYQREELMYAAEGEELSEKVNFLGYIAKGGANYNLTENHNVFANLGYFEKAPDFRAVFADRRSNQANTAAVNQKILSYELGYGYRSSTFSANVNLYRTNWRDRTFTRFIGETQEGEPLFANILGVNALHQGVELDFMYRPTDRLTINGMASVGDWTWQNNVENIEIYGEDGDLEDVVNLYVAGLKVGDAAQTTAAVVVDYEMIDGFTLGFTANHYDNLFARYDPTSRDAESEAVADKAQSWELPSYQLLDLNARYKFKVAGLDASVWGNINNLFDTEYVAEAIDGEGHDAASANGYYGFGRTYRIGMKLNF